MTDPQRVHGLAGADVEAELAAAVAGDGGSPPVVVELSTGGVPGRRGFFDTCRRAVALDPPVVSERSWDALEDSLWQGLFELAGQRIVIVWRDASAYAGSSPREHGMAVELLAHVAGSLAEARYTTGRPKDVQVFLGRPGWRRGGQPHRSPSRPGRVRPLGLPSSGSEEPRWVRSAPSSATARRRPSRLPERGTPGRPH